MVVKRLPAETDIRPEYLLIILLLAVALAVPLLNKPDLYWEWINLSAAEGILDTGVPKAALWSDEPLLIHPPSWAYAIAFSQGIFGNHFWSARLPGLCVFLVTGLLLWLLILQLGYGMVTAHVASVIYLTNPFALQGMLSLDYTDGSLLPLSAVLFSLVRVASRSHPLRTQVVMLGLCLCFAFWAKITTATILLVAFFFVTLLGAKADRNWKLFAGVVCFGGGATLLTWSLYCLYLKVILGDANVSVLYLASSPLRYLLSGGAAAPIWEIPIGSSVLVLLRGLFYLGPAVAILSVPSILDWAHRWWKEKSLPKGSIVKVFPLGVLFGYTLFLGGTGPFPKYFLPALPFLALFTALFLTKQGVTSWGHKPAFVAILVIPFTVYYVVVVSDYIYLLNYQLRLGVYSGAPGPVFMEILIAQCFYLLPFGLLLLFPYVSQKNLSVRLLVLVALVSSQMAICLIQGFSGYSVRYLYGTPYEDLKAIDQALQEFGEPRTVLGNAMISFSSQSMPVEGNSNAIWDSNSEVKRLIREERPSAVVYGLPINTIQQVNSVNSDEELQALLSSRYDMTEIGLFWLWLEKPAE